ncbi:hypothetical protein Tco_1577450 [Tanacetum coccineum]
MMTLKFENTHKHVAFLSKPEESDEFEQIVDFLNARPIKYALTVNPTIYISCIEQFWSTVKAKTINGEVQLHALVDGKKVIITKVTVRRDLQLEDEEGVDCLPNSTIFEQLTLMGKPKRKDTQVPQPSGPTDIVTDKAVHKELGDSLVRAATTASSLAAEQDSGNIAKTRSKATPNESSSLGTTSGGGPKCQKTIGDTYAQTRFENELQTSLMIPLPHRREKEVKNLWAERLRKVGATARVESSRDEDLDGEEVFITGQKENVVEEAVDSTQVNTATITTEEITLAQALEALKTSKPKGKGIIIEEPVKPMKKKDLIRLDEEVALKLQAEFDEEERLAREKDEANVALTERMDDIQAKIEADHELAQRLKQERFC